MRPPRAGGICKYRPGLLVTDLGMGAFGPTRLQEHTHPYLKGLRQRTSHSVSVGVPNGTEVLCVDRARSLRRARSQRGVEPLPGSGLPPHFTAMGKMLLANLPEEEQRSRRSSLTLRKRRRNTITG
jgi:IclR family pca regulon transcriptional regulator